MAYRQDKVDQLAAAIAARAKVAAELPEGHPVRKKYLRDIEDLEDERHTAESGAHADRWARACGLGALGIIVASTGLPTGILLGGLFAAVALAVVARKL
ncbi:hypothetical protein AB0A05_26975 [Streptomyces sp. NPDC046374]|uniref:hypothetical protein n=1 Tax=Streptomyces sp. NPDC046374 TaxID=3154917 RepID=UPI0033E7C4B7